jgi:hypothetical protein
VIIFSIETGKINHLPSRWRMRARRLMLKVFEQVAAHVATIVAAIHLKQGGKST